LLEASPDRAYDKGGVKAKQWLETGAADFWFSELMVNRIIWKDNSMAFVAVGL
jgi:hypothetical protein